MVWVELKTLRWTIIILKLFIPVMSSDRNDILDRIWVRDLKENSHEVFEQIFRIMNPRLFRFALNYTMNAGVAEDIVSEVFLCLWRMAGSLPDHTNITSYLYSSVKNAYSNSNKHF